MFEQEIQQLSNELAARQQGVLEHSSMILGRDVNMESLHAIIGGKNRTHADVWNRTFSCFDEFFAVWLEAMYKDYQSRVNDDEPMERAGYRNAMLLKEADIMEYAELFLRRNFLRNYDQRKGAHSASLQEVAKWQKEVDRLKQLFYSTSTLQHV